MMRDSDGHMLTRGQWDGIFVLVVIALFVVIALAGCSSKPTGVDVHDWCLNDHFLCKSHADTPATQAEIDQHNTGYVTACPKQPHECK